MDKNCFKIGGAVFAGLLLLGASPRSGFPQADVAASGQEPVEYVIEDIQGSNVQVLEDGERAWEPAQEGQVLESGDEIKVGEKSETTLMLQSETSVHLNEQCDLKVGRIEANGDGGFWSRLQLLAGRILADVKKNLEDSRSTFEVEANGVVCGVRGTAFEVTAQDTGAQVATQEGEVEVGNDAGTYRVTAGNFSSFKDGRLRMRRRLARSEIRRFERWRSFRQGVLKKRLRRLADIRQHVRKPWIRRHPHLRKRFLRHEAREKRRRRGE